MITSAVNAVTGWIMEADVVLRARELTKRYGELTAVDGLSLEVRRGEILGFLGPNGAGKTTTIRMLCGLLRPDGGSVEIDGQQLRAGRAHGPCSIGVSPQEIVVWDTLTCQEQLELMGRLYDLPHARARERASTLLEAFGLQDKREKLARTLSGGMQRRLNIALALVHQPGILFLDEPQAGLDPQSRLLVREYIRSLAGNTTVVVTTHDMEEAEKISHRVCIVDHGRLLVLDTVEAVKDQLGEGDLFEISLAGGVAAELLPHLEGLGREGVSFSAIGSTLGFTSPTGPELLAQILRVIEDQGARVEQLRMRQRNLEDVFIRLTGRGLRE